MCKYLDISLSMPNLSEPILLLVITKMDIGLSTFLFFFMFQCYVAQNIKFNAKVCLEIVEKLQSHASFKPRNVNILSNNEMFYKNIASHFLFLTHHNSTKEYQVHFFPYYEEYLNFESYVVPKNAAVFNLETTQDEKYEL